MTQFYDDFELHAAALIMVDQHDQERARDSVDEVFSSSELGSDHDNRSDQSASTAHGSYWNLQSQFGFTAWPAATTGDLNSYDSLPIEVTEGGCTYTCNNL